MNNNIIIVGNGSSLLDKKNGSIIDSFNIIVRFNSYKIKKFEEYVGTKTNVWFTVNLHHISELRNYDNVIVHSWEWDKNKCNIYQKINKIKKCTKITREFVNSIPCKNPSTGLIAIYHYLQFYPCLAITGFDWWEREKHHYGDNEVRGTLHKPLKEYELIKQLNKEKKIYFI